MFHCKNFKNNFFARVIFLLLTSYISYSIANKIVQCGSIQPNAAVPKKLKFKFFPKRIHFLHETTFKYLIGTCTCIRKTSATFHSIFHLIPIQF